MNWIFFVLTEYFPVNCMYTANDEQIISFSFPALVDIDVDIIFSLNPFVNTKSHICKSIRKMQHCCSSELLLHVE